MLLYLLAQQQQVDPVATGLLQYGAIGILALVGLIAVRMLWKKIDHIYEVERQRADRLEEKLFAQTTWISTELSGQLVRSTEAMREVTDMLRHRDRDR